ncbi:MAG: hypothetical protein R2705_14135 [Ilumatobacteraceae bacterium]
MSIVGRLKELIISGGFNVYPREVEDVLRLPGIRDAAVVGRPDPEWGELVTAFVEVTDRGAFDEAAVLARCRAELVALQAAPTDRGRRLLASQQPGKAVRRDPAS